MECTPNKTMTISLPPDEMAILECLAKSNGLTKISAIRKAIRIYNLIDQRTKRGEKVFVEPNLGQKSEILLA